MPRPAARTRGGGCRNTRPGRPSAGRFEIGRGSCRGKGEISGGGGSFKKKKKNKGGRGHSPVSYEHRHRRRGGWGGAACYPHRLSSLVSGSVTTLVCMLLSRAAWRLAAA